MQLKDNMTHLSVNQISQVNSIISRMDEECRENGDLPIEVHLTFKFSPADTKLVVSMNGYLHEEIEI